LEKPPGGQLFSQTHARPAQLTLPTCPHTHTFTRRAARRQPAGRLGGRVRPGGQALLLPQDDTKDAVGQALARCSSLVLGVVAAAAAARAHRDLKKSQHVMAWAPGARALAPLAQQASRHGCLAHGGATASREVELTSRGGRRLLTGREGASVTWHACHMAHAERAECVFTHHQSVCGDPAPTARIIPATHAVATQAPTQAAAQTSPSSVSYYRPCLLLLLRPPPTWAA
jgi:hypothetical protein